ncbi:hypothetical protein V1L52_07590 [Treponema sp. HNW]|uniref:hypothetical protein n=1 Tax=Treponema sp. HNW TaxID=3116654 RepID=UPI003D104667
MKQVPKRGQRAQKNLHKRSAEAFLSVCPSASAKCIFMNDISSLPFVALNELIGYTMSKDIADYTAKDFWIRFLSNYAKDKQSGMLKKLCTLEEGLEMAEATLCRVTEEERRIARELSTQHYYDILADERAEGREEGKAIGRAEGARQKALETARILKQLGDSSQKIVQVTGLSEAEIEKL